tara:strand:+ start:6856 stop:7686 length:831 start_codon:yes stop_codon:yes gene_type:complete
MANTFLPGYAVKPNLITETGVVTFTDGTTEFPPNQTQCEAYGYAYNRVTGTCSAFTYSTKLGENMRNESNNVQGSGNVTGIGANNSFIMGESNLIAGDSNNNIVIGDSNEIASGVNNACVLGNYGIARRPGEVVIGGGGFNGLGKGYAQSSVITLTGVTSNASTTALDVNGGHSTEIARDADKTFLSYEAALIGVRTGGAAAGSTHDRIFQTLSGITFETTANESSAVTVEVGSVTGWTGVVAFDAEDKMVFNVNGAVDMDITWSCTLNIYEMKIT